MLFFLKNLSKEQFLGFLIFVFVVIITAFCVELTAKIADQI